MASEDLAASMKTLDLGPSDDPKTSDVKAVADASIKNTRRKIKTLQEQGFIKSKDDLCTVPFNPQTKQEAKVFNAPSVENTHPRNLPNPSSPNSQSRRPRNCKKTWNGAKSTSRPTAPPGKAQHSATQISSPKSPQGEPTFVYVIEASAFGTVKIVGAFMHLSKANERVEEYITQCGLANVDTVDIRSKFAFNGPKPQDIPKLVVSRRGSWANGASETCLPDNSTGVSKLRVLPRDSTFSTEDTEFIVAYLAMDSTELGLMVIGAYRTKEQAWQACEKYWNQLSYLNEMQKEKEWFDERGMHHVWGFVGGRAHHFFVEMHALNPEVEADLRIIFGGNARN
jgi:hypothetical protein